MIYICRSVCSKEIIKQPKGKELMKYENDKKAVRLYQ